MPITNNKYIPLILQGVDMVVEDAARSKEMAFQRENMNAAAQKQRIASQQAGKMGLLEGVWSSEDVDPELRNKAFETGLNVLEQPETDVGILKPFQETKKKYGLSEFALKHFPQYKGTQLPADEARQLESEATERYSALKPKETSKGSGLTFNFGGKSRDADPYLSTIADYKDRATKMFMQGYGPGAEKEKVETASVGRFLDALDTLERHIKFDQWSEQDEKVFNELKPLEVQLGGFEELNSKFQEAMNQVYESLKGMK